jgi:hypothetical protein
MDTMNIHFDLLFTDSTYEEFDYISFDLFCINLKNCRSFGHSPSTVFFLVTYRQCVGYFLDVQVGLLLILFCTVWHLSGLGQEDLNSHGSTYFKDLKQMLILYAAPYNLKNIVSIPLI